MGEFPLEMNLGEGAVEMFNLQPLSLLILISSPDWGDPTGYSGPPIPRELEQQGKSPCQFFIQRLWCDSQVGGLQRCSLHSAPAKSLPTTDTWNSDVRSRQGVCPATLGRVSLNPILDPAGFPLSPPIPAPSCSAE